MFYVIIIVTAANKVLPQPELTVLFSALFPYSSSASGLLLKFHLNGRVRFLNSHQQPADTVTNIQAEATPNVSRYPMMLLVTLNQQGKIKPD